MKRRGFLAGLLALPFAKPAVSAALNAIERMGAPTVAAQGRSYFDLAAANACLKELYSGVRIADYVYSNNGLFERIEQERARRAALTPAERLAEDAQRKRDRWREQPRWAFDRGYTVRVDSRAPSGYAAWLEAA